MPVIINGSTGISGTDGSAGTPAVQGTDANTGIFFPAADTIAFSEGGVESMRLDSSGNVTLTGNLTLGGNFVPGSSFLRNRIINGDMRIDQRNNGAATANTISGYTLDRWNVFQTVTGRLIAQRNAGSVTPPAGFTNYLGVTSQTAYSILASDYYVIDQRIEGFNTADLNWGTASAVAVTLSFWVRSSLTGTFGGAILNSAQTRSYPFSYTISVANTWEYKTITIPGDTTGTWLTDNGVGINVTFGLGVGSTFSAAAGAWTGSARLSATGATSVVGTNGATFYLTGVQLEVGSVATPFERRQFGAELTLCQRYFFLWNTHFMRANGTHSGAANYTMPTSLPVTMRTTPTTTAGSVSYFNTSLGNPIAANSNFEVGWNFNITGQGTDGFATWTNFQFSAEL